MRKSDYDFFVDVCVVLHATSIKDVGSDLVLKAFEEHGF